MSAQHEIDAGERFAFGANWARFLREVDDERIEAAKSSLVAALGSDDLAGARFLDMGSGSGLFSLAAHLLGADVVSVDFDPASVACAEVLRSRFGEKSRPWTIAQGSVLDVDLIGGLGVFDVVYSWGVLHHTGRMWRALELIDHAVAPGGRLFISIYNDQGLPSRVWTRLKRGYNAAGPVGRGAILWGAKGYFGARSAAAYLISARGRPTASRTRGMSRATDLVDWVGGYPFEVASPEQIFEFYRERGYVLTHLKTCRGGLGCNEFVFVKNPA